MTTATRLFGSSIKRREDPRFITGKGTYVDDVKLPGMTYAIFVRSPHAHARIKAINTAQAKSAPGGPPPGPGAPSGDRSGRRRGFWAGGSAAGWGSRWRS